MSKGYLFGPNLIHQLKETAMNIQTSLTDLSSQSSDTFDFRSSDEIDVKVGHDQNIQNAVNKAIWNTTWTDTTTEEASTTLDAVEAAIEGALTVRDISTDTLSVSQSDTFDMAADQIHTVLGSDIETSADVEELFGDTLNVRFVDDLTTTDGDVLNGAAVLGTDEIVLNSALEGQALRETLTEEIAETAFQKAFDTTSQGDFGAEVIARTQSEETDEKIATYSQAVETDTVDTEFGTAEAYEQSQLDPFIEALEANNPGIDVVDIGFSLADDNEYAEFYGNTGDGTETTFWGEDAFDSSLLIPQADASDEAFDFDLDGNQVSSAQWFFDPASDPQAEIVSRAGDYRYRPIDELTSLWNASENPGESRVSISYEEGKSYSLTEETNWSEGISINGSVKATIGPFEIAGGADTTSENGASTSQQNTITSSVTQNITEVLQAEDYPEDWIMTVGEHELIADVNVTSEYTIWVALYEQSGGVDPDAYIKINVEDTRIVEDYLMEVAFTKQEYEGLPLDDVIAQSFDADFGFG